MLPLFPHDGCVSTGVYVAFAQNIKRQFVTKGQLMSRFAIGGHRDIYRWSLGSQKAYSHRK